MLVPAGVSNTFSAVFPGAVPARVALSVYDDSGESPVLVQDPTLMAEVLNPVYRGKFTPASGIPYIVLMAVYETGAFEDLDTDFTPVTVDLIAEYLTPPVQNVVGIVGCNDGEFEPPCPFSIFLGDTKTMYLRAVNVMLGLLPLDLSDCSEIEVRLPLADGTTEVRKLSDSEVVIASPPVLGQFSCPIPDDVSDLLNVGELQTFPVTFTIGESVFTVSFERALSVFQR